MGACLPNLREDDPSKIAAGFGGTLNLLVSLAFITVVVASLAIPSRIYIASLYTGAAAFAAVPFDRFLSWLLWSGLLILFWGALATIIPLRMGIRAFERLDF
jgi:ABC-2 type transport system permease protein